MACEARNNETKTLKVIDFKTHMKKTLLTYIIVMVSNSLFSQNLDSSYINVVVNHSKCLHDTTFSISEKTECLKNEFSTIDTILKNTIKRYLSDINNDCVRDSFIINQNQWTISINKICEKNIEKNISNESDFVYWLTMTEETRKRIKQIEGLEYRLKRKK
jgi:uncharacterized protein YecT (DUF1311 family)